MSNDFDWFDLKKYQELSDIDLACWHRQLQIRGLIYSSLLSEESKDNKKVAQNNEEYKKHLQGIDDYVLNG